MKLFRDEEEAVSPVIGVILMVAIVVILAAVIAAFVFGMAGTAGTSKNVGMTVTKVTGANDATSGFDILWQGGSDINSLTSITFTVDGANTGYTIGPSGGTLAAPPYTPATGFGVGDVTSVLGGDVTGSRVIITGTFSDGAAQVLYDRQF